MGFGSQVSAAGASGAAAGVSGALSGVAGGAAESPGSVDSAVVFYARDGLLFVPSAAFPEVSQGDRFRLVRRGREVGRAVLWRNRSEFGHLVLRRTEGTGTSGDLAVFEGPGIPNAPIVWTTPTGETTIVWSDAGVGLRAEVRETAPVPRAGLETPHVAPPETVPAVRAAPEPRGVASPETVPAVRAAPEPPPAPPPRRLVFPFQHPNPEVVARYLEEVLPEYAERFDLTPVSEPFVPASLETLLTTMRVSAALVPRWEKGRVVMELYDTGPEPRLLGTHWIDPYGSRTRAPSSMRWGPFRRRYEIRGFPGRIEAVLPLGGGGLLVRDGDAIYQFDADLDFVGGVVAPEGTRGVYRYGDRIAVRAEAPPWAERARHVRARPHGPTSPLPGPTHPSHPPRSEYRVLGWAGEEPLWEEEDPLLSPLSLVAAPDEGDALAGADEAYWTDLDGDGEVEVLVRKGERIEVHVPTRNGGFAALFRSPTLPGLAGVSLRVRETGDEVWLWLRGEEEGRIVVLTAEDIGASSRIE